jgi:hypothetical protein
MHAWLDEWVLGVVDVVVWCGAVIEAAVEEGEWDVVLHIERAVGVVGANTWQAIPLGLVASIEIALWVIDRVEANEALLHV